MNKRIATESGQLIVELGATKVTFPAGARPSARIQFIAAQYLDQSDLEAFSLLADVFECAEVSFKDISDGD